MPTSHAPSCRMTAASWVLAPRSQNTSTTQYLCLGRGFTRGLSCGMTTTVPGRQILLLFAGRVCPIVKVKIWAFAIARQVDPQRDWQGAWPAALTARLRMPQDINCPQNFFTMQVCLTAAVCWAAGWAPRPSKSPLLCGHAVWPHPYSQVSLFACFPFDAL